VGFEQVKFLRKNGRLKERGRSEIRVCTGEQSAAERRGTERVEVKRGEGRV